MTIRELTVRSYDAFIPYFETLPNTHRYVRAFHAKFISTTQAITDRSRNLLNQRLRLEVDRTRAMTDRQFADSGCADKLCSMFHVPTSKVIRMDEIFGGFRIVQELVEDNVNGGIVERVEEKVNGQWVDRGVLTEA